MLEKLSNCLKISLLWLILSFPNLMWGRESVADSIPDPKNLSDDKVIFHIYRLSDWAASLENAFEQLYYSASYARKGVLSEIKMLKKDKNTPRSVVKQRIEALNNLEEIEADCKKKFQQAKKVADFGVKLSTSDDLKAMRKALPKLDAQVKELIQKSKENAAIAASIDWNAASKLQMETSETSTQKLEEETEVTGKKKVKKEKSTSPKPQKEKQGKKKKEAPQPSKSSKKGKKTEKKSKNPDFPTLLDPNGEPPVEQILTKNLEVVAAQNAISRPATIAKYDPKKDVMLFPPQPPCHFLFNGRDEFSGQRRLDLQREVWFTYTNDMLKPHLKGKSHITCEASITSTGAAILLNLNFTIIESSARRSFGGIARGSQLTLKFVDGTALTISSLRNDDGEMDAAGQVATFKSQYILDKTTLKKMRQTEMDKIRMSWNRGFEDYEIFNVDLLQRQVRCLGE